MRDNVIFFYGNINYSTSPSVIVPFFEMEYLHLQKSFKRVIVVTGCRDKKSVNQLPQDNAVFVLLSRNEIISRFYLVFAMLFSSDFWHELFSVLKKHAHIKDFVKAMSIAFHGRVLASAAKKKCRKYDLDNNGNKWTAYSFWHSGEAYAVSCLKKRYPDLKAISRAHAGDIDARINPPMAYLMRQTIPKYIDKICFISEDSVSKYRKTIGLLPKGKVAIAYLGTQKDGTILSKQSTDGWLRIVSCANLKSGKRINLIIEAIALAAQRDNIKIQWAHFGGGDLQKDINTLAAECFTEKDNIKWTLAGNVPNCDIHSYYKANPVDLFLSMSESEGVPVSFMEAMSYGIPVMTTDVGGVREIINDVCGIMLEKSDADAASDAILKFNSLSGAERQKLRNRAYKVWNEKFNGDKNFSDFADKYLKG